MIAAIALRSVPSFAALRDALAQSAGDPALTVVFPHDGSVVDADGASAAPAALPGPRDAVTGTGTGQQAVTPS